MAELENFSQATDDDKAIQASIQASLKELMGEQAVSDVPSDLLQEQNQGNTQELAQNLETEPMPEVSVDSIIEVAEKLAQEENYIEPKTQDSADDFINDIQFEEVLDIDAIQQKLLERIYEEDSPIVSSQDVNTVIDKEAAIIEEKKAKLPIKYNSITSKKYVIYIDSENIDFIENLSIDERKEIINKILKEQNEISIKTKEYNSKAKYIKHVLVACLTFLIGFPLMFIIVNKSLESSMDNYQQAKQNVSKLYKDHGKIKIVQPQ